MTLSGTLVVLRLFAGILVFFGSYLLFSDVFRIPTVAASLALRRAGRPKDAPPTAVDVWLGGLSGALAKLLSKVQSDSVKEKLASDLAAVGDRRTPEAYLADCVTRALPVALLALPCLFVFPVLAPFALAGAVLYGTTLYRSAGRTSERKREEIEEEMPAFVARITASLKHGRNVLSILDGCRTYAGPALKRELDVTAADMRTGNDETALSRLEIRAGSPLMTEAVRGLRAVLRGDDTEAYWMLLQARCSDERKQRLRREANRIPRKVRRLSLCMLICFLLTYLTVIGVQLADSLGILFG